MMALTDDRKGADHTALQRRLGASRRELLIGWMPWIGLAFVVALLAWFSVKPAPPKRVVIAAGPSGGSYDYFAKEYQKLLKQSGIELEVRATAGTQENYRLLESGEASVAITQGGAAQEGLHGEFRSLASLYLEPVWVFSRGAAQGSAHIRDFKGKRIAIGPEGSGTRAVAIKLLAANGIDVSPGSTDGTTLSPLTGAAAADALRRGELDALFIVIAPGAPIIKDLLKPDVSKSIQLLNFERHEAYVRLFPYLADVKLPRGVLDLEHDLPADDIYLIAPSANLIARSDIHPAIVSLLMKAAFVTHESGGLLKKPGEFPNLNYTEWPIDPAAREYVRVGPPFLQRYLPFWLAALFDRLKIFLLPLLTLLLPLMRVAPPLYQWRTRSRIYRWYRLLREVDVWVTERETPDAKVARGAESIEHARGDLSLLRQLDAELAAQNVPLSYMAEYYHLRLHAEFVRRRLERLLGSVDTETKI